MVGFVSQLPKAIRQQLRASTGQRPLPESLDLLNQEWVPPDFEVRPCEAFRGVERRIPIVHLPHNGPSLHPLHRLLHEIVEGLSHGIRMEAHLSHEYLQGPRGGEINQGPRLGSFLWRHGIGGSHKKEGKNGHPEEPGSEGGEPAPSNRNSIRSEDSHTSHPTLASTFHR